MQIKPIRRVNVSDQVFQQLKNLLIKGDWAQGEKIPSENELADQFGVSRITVRQAIQKLGTLGLLETRLGEGSFVKTVKPADSMNALMPTVYLNNHDKDTMYEVQEFREIVEIESTRLAAGKATKQDVAILKKIYESMKENKGDLKKFAKEDFEFHFKIGQMTKNDLLIKTYMILKEVLQISMTEIIEEMGSEGGLRYHAELIQAFEQKDGIKAAEIMRKHISENKEYYH